MENEKSPRGKSNATLSIASLVFAIIGILVAAVTIISTKGNFTTLLVEMIPDELPFITKFLVVSIPTFTYEIFFTSLILILVLKELFFRNKMVTLMINIVIGLIAIVCVPVYIVAIYLPIVKAAL